MNKVLPGAYFRFEAVKKPEGAIGDRGITAMPLPLSWGPHGQVIELLSTDLSDGKSLTKVGFTAQDKERSRCARLCLGNCYKLLVWRINSGGEKAAATIGNLTATAKYDGVVGNEIKVAVVENGGKMDVVTFYREEEQDRQTVGEISELIGNDWADFSGSGNLAASAGTVLSGGTDGTVTEGNYTAYLEAMKTQSWQTMGIPSEDAKLPPIVTEYINNLRDASGRYVQAVVYNYNTADSVGVISSKQGFETEDEEVSPAEFVAWVAGASAGVQVSETNCYKAVKDAVKIIGDLPEDELAEELKKGWYLLGKRVDGTIVVVDDVNTFTSYSDTADQDFSDNFVIRLFDEIAMTTRKQFELMKIGKAGNTAAGRDALKAQLIANFEALQNMRPDGAIQNFAAEDITVAAGERSGDVIVTGYIQPAGHMKKLYGTFYKGKEA